MPHAYESKYPNLAGHFSSKKNIGVILEVIETQCDHLFQLNELEKLDRDLWIELLKKQDPYFKFFSECIDNSGEGYTTDEVKRKLFPFIHEKINSKSWSQQDFSLSDGLTQIGFWEKFQEKKLSGNLNDNNTLKQYAFTTLDMARSGQVHTVPVKVLELRHLDCLPDKKTLSQPPLYIRSTSGDKRGLHQWILYYHNNTEPCLYSESPILEEDKKHLMTLFNGTLPRIEGGAAALSMSSGIRTIARYVQTVGGAGLSSSADYFSLLIEWQWLTKKAHPRRLKTDTFGLKTNNWTWEYFKQHVLQYDPTTQEFSLLDFKETRGNEEYNEHLQMRSYYLGLDQALMDDELKILKVDPKASAVTLNLDPARANSDDVKRVYNQKYAKKAEYVFAPQLFMREKSGKLLDQGDFLATLVLNTFRACAKEKNLIIHLPPAYHLTHEETALISYLMNMNPFVCQFQNPEKNLSLAKIQENLQHIFARNRWLSINHYLPPLLDEFWFFAAEYWVAFLKQSPDLFSDHEAISEFKQCVKEMGLHGLNPLLEYLKHKENELKPAFNALLKNLDTPPVFYAACPAKEVSGYTQALIQHIKNSGYFPFKRLQFSFVPGVHREIINLLNELNSLEHFDKISLTDCLSSPEAKAALQLFLREAIRQATENETWTCPIHIPELEKPIDDPNAREISSLYGQLNNILIQRTRKKHAKPLLDMNEFKAVALMQEIPPKAPAALPTQTPKTQAKGALKTLFHQKTTQLWPKSDDKLALTRAGGGISLQMQQQQQIKQERNRCLDNEMQHGTAYKDILPAELVDYTNIDQLMAEDYQKLTKDGLIQLNKATLSGGTLLQNFFHTWVNANPETPAKHIIRKMTPYAVKMLLKYHRQLSGGLNVENLPRGFYTQRIANGELVLGYKSTLGYTTDHNPLTMQLTTAIPKAEHVLGTYEQFLSKPTDPPRAFEYLLLLAQMQPKLTEAEKKDRYDEFLRTEFRHLPQKWKVFYQQHSNWIQNHWEIFYSSIHSNHFNDETLVKFQAHATSNQSLGLEKAKAMEHLLANIFNTPEEARQKKCLMAILLRHPSLDYAISLGQVYSQYGDYGLGRFANLVLTIENRLGPKFTDSFFRHYLSCCETYAPLLQETALLALDEMIRELSQSEEESNLFQAFLALQMQAVEWEDISLLWKSFRYFYNQMKDMGLESSLTPETLRQIRPQGQNLLPCFERILRTLQAIPNPASRKDFVKELAQIDLSEGGAPYAMAHDGFKFVAPELNLAGFMDGAPTYTPPMKDLYTDQWQKVHTLRSLASKAHIKREDYNRFIHLKSKDQLIWALHTEVAKAHDLLDFLSETDLSFVSLIAGHLHRVCDTHQPLDKRFPLSTFKLLIPYQSKLLAVLQNHPNDVTIFDCVNKCQLDTKPNDIRDRELDRLFRLFNASDKTHPHLGQGLLLCSVFGLNEKARDAFYQRTKNLKQVTRNELVILTQQLLSLDLDTLPDDPAKRDDIWRAILSFIDRIDSRPLEAANTRKELMQHLKQAPHHLTFKSSIAGDYRCLTDEDLNGLGLEQFFEQHASRLKSFFKTHIAISQSQDISEQLTPIIAFFKRLQLNKTYINEVEPLLATFENVLKDLPKECWTADYFSGFMRALQPEDTNQGFPIGVLQALLIEPQSPLRPALIDELQPAFDPDKKWQAIWNAILTKGQTFTRAQQAQLARLSVACMQQMTFIPSLVEQLANKSFDGLRDVVLERLQKSDAAVIERTFEQCRSLLALPHKGISEPHWKSTCGLWIETLTTHPEFEAFFVRHLEPLKSPEKELVLHIIAYSSFPSHKHPTVPSSDYFQGGERAKVVKLATRLQALSVDELQIMANCYPRKPAPDTRELLKLIKDKEHTPIADGLKMLLTTQQAIARQDYAQMTTSRESDLARLLELTYVTRDKQNEHIAPESGIKLTLMFQYLKQLEQGKMKVGAHSKSLNEMTQDELQEVFREISEKLITKTDDILLKTQVWAVLFEVLGRTTGKYPHLAQQFALLANDELLKGDPSSILQLKTGEGKSHFIALRAARLAGLGKKVDVCTAKWSLATRDLLDYHLFFDYLGIKTANIHARSTRETYEDARIVYTTPGDLSLFLDEQASQGTPIQIDPNTQAGLGDEFDFLYYEGQKTQFNYARHTGLTPKDMSWFYCGINAFYDEKIKTKITSPEPSFITPALLLECFTFLENRANEDGRLYLQNITPMVLLSWLQSAHKAATMLPGVDYTARLEQVTIGEEVFPLREIYPLTTDMQAAVGSTFSHGLHQLLAERLNVQAKKDGEPQNYHVHPESDIISSQVFSQRLKTLWGHWEGFTGTVSSSQACELHQSYKTAVLRLPTNQKDLRQWPEPHFFRDQKQREERLIQDIRQRLKNKKSILLCCATDAEVKKTEAFLKKHFEKTEYEQHFLCYTNESHDTPSEILRKKREMEGEALGQKERGVVLCAAGFGRGDNVEVETVMLSSVHDDNDLKQKGGRTARNGEEGEVLQYYLRDELEEELEQIIKGLKESKNSGLLRRIQDGVNPEKKLPGELQDPLTRIFFLDGIDLKRVSPKDKFDLLIRLREFIATAGSYPSRVYNEAKAVISSEGIRLIGEASLEKKEQLIKGFADYLSFLEKEWARIESQNQGNEDACIAALHELIASNLDQNGRLMNLFLDIGRPRYAAPTPPKPEFVLEVPPAPTTEKASLMSAAQGLLLKLVDFPMESSRWEQMITSLASLNESQLRALLYDCQNKSILHFDEFQHQVESLAQPHQITEEIQAYTHIQGSDLAALKASIPQDVTNAIQLMPGEASDLAWRYILTPGLENPQLHIDKAMRMITYSSKKSDISLSFWNHAATRDALLSLPAACFDEPVYLNATILIDIKKFLDRHIDPNHPSYVSLFRQLMRSTAHQSEKRKRLLGEYETILTLTEKPKEDLLRQLISLGEQFRSEEHFTLLKRLINKMKSEYQQPRLPIKDLDQCWDDLLNMGPGLLQMLPLIEKLIAKEGKEFPSILHILSKLDTNLTIFPPDFLEHLFYNKARKSKKPHLEVCRETFTYIQETLSDANDLKTALELFGNFLLSPAFYNTHDKRVLLSQMKAVILNGIPKADLFPKFDDEQKMMSFLRACEYFPQHIKKLAALDGLIAYIQANHNQLSELERTELTRLLEKVPSKFNVEKLAKQLQEFHRSNTLYELLYLSSQNPEHATDLLSLEPIVAYFASPHHQALKPNEKAKLLSGMKIFLKKTPPDKRASALKRWNQLNDDTKKILLSLLAQYPNAVTENGIEDFAKIATFLSGRIYTSFKNDLREMLLSGLHNLLSKKGPVIFTRLRELDVKDSFSPEEFIIIFEYAHHYPEQAHDLILFKPMINYLALGENFSLDESPELYSALQVLLTINMKHDKRKKALESWKTLDDDGKKRFLLLLAKHPSIVTQKSLDCFFHIAACLSCGQYKAVNQEYQTTILSGVTKLLANSPTILTSLSPLPHEKLLTLFYLTACDPNPLPKDPLNLEAWLNDALLRLSSDHRVRLMQFLKYYDQSLFKIGLGCYEAYIQEGFTKQKTTNTPLATSPKQRGILNVIMGEFRNIGRLENIKRPSSRDNMKVNVEVQVAQYQKIKLKDQTRYEKVKQKIENLTNLRENKDYEALLKEIRDIRTELINQDIQTASRQWLPRLHFSGQSRLYNTLKAMENLVLEAWSKDVIAQKATPDNFFTTYQDNRNASVQAFKNALRTWNDKPGRFFKDSSRQLEGAVRFLSEEDTLKYLKDHPKIVSALPGTLRAIANEVLVQDAIEIKEINAEKRSGHQ